MYILSCKDLSFFTEEKTLFSRLGFSLFPGSIFHLRGKNGSGKTSLLRMMAGIQNPSSGTITIGGISLTGFEKPYANYIGHNNGVKEDLTVFENIKIFAQLYDSESAVSSAIHYFGLIETLDKKVHSLSAGNKQKVALARLFCCNSNFWFLDEIDSHLDKENKNLLYNIIATKANNGGIIIMTSHQKIEMKNIMFIDIEDFGERV